MDGRDADGIGTSGLVVDQCDFADNCAGPELRQLLTVLARDVDASIENHEKVASFLPLFAQALVCKLGFKLS